MFFLTENDYAWNSPPNDDYLTLNDNGRMLKEFKTHEDYRKAVLIEQTEDERRNKLENILLENNVSITKFQKSAGLITIIASVIITSLSCWISYLTYRLNKQTFEIMVKDKKNGQADSPKSILPSLLLQRKDTSILPHR